MAIERLMVAAPFEKSEVVGAEYKTLPAWVSLSPEFVVRDGGWYGLHNAMDALAQRESPLSVRGAAPAMISLGTEHQAQSTSTLTRTFELDKVSVRELHKKVMGVLRRYAEYDPNNTGDAWHPVISHKADFQLEQDEDFEIEQFAVFRIEKITQALAGSLKALYTFGEGAHE